MQWRQFGMGRDRAGWGPKGSAVGWAETWRGRGGRELQAEGTHKQDSEARYSVCVAASPLPEEEWVGGAPPSWFERQDEHPSQDWECRKCPQGWPCLPCYKKGHS